jgi:hypothetical protein
MIKYKSNGTWFDKNSLVRLITDYRPELDSGLFIGYCENKIDEEICSFDEFTEVEIAETDTELDKAFDFQDAWWKERKTL